MRFTKYSKAVDYLTRGASAASSDIGPHSAQTLMQQLGNPQNAHPAVHVAGTSGKGTVCYLIDALLRAHTKRTGMTQNPHIYDIRERIQVNGQLVSERLFVRTLDAVLGRIEPLHPTQTQIVTAMAYSTFAHSRLDYVVIEAGTGGQHDATNIMTDQKKVCVLTQIGYENPESSKTTLVDIAAASAAIIEPHNFVVALRQDTVVNDVFEARCREQHATILWVEPGDTYQRTNDALALAVCRALADRDAWKFDEAVADATLQQVFIPGRFERRYFKDHLVILDGAHNPQKLTALASEIIRKEKAPATIVLATNTHSDVAACVAALQPVAARIIATEFATPKHSAPPELIAEASRAASIETYIHPSVHQAMNFASSFAQPIVVTGSFDVVGEADRFF